MVAPAGVNEGTPQEPVKAGSAEAVAVPAEVVPGGEMPAGAVPAEVVPPPAEPAEGERVAAPGRTLAEATPAEAEQEEADPAEAEHAAAEPALGDTAAVGDTAAAEPIEAAPIESEHAEAGPGEPDWDAGEQSRDISPLAVAGIVLVVIALVAVAVGVLAVITHGFRPKTVITYRPAAVFGLRPGECVNSGANALTVTVVSCATPHDAEVFASFSLPKTGWPGDSAAQQAAGDGCQSRLAGYLNPQLTTADLTQEFVYPNQAAWQAGERTVICEIRASSGPLSGSVRATN